MGKWIRLFSILLILAFLSVGASAHPVPEPGRKGSITVSMRFDGEAVPGGSLTLYWVGEVSQNDGNYSFVPTGDFTRWGTEFGALDSAEENARTAHSLKTFAQSQEPPISGIEKQIGKDGMAKFSNREQGLYLLVQTRPAPGYSPVNPFLVSIPYEVKGEYCYDVDAQAKTKLEQEPTPTKPPEKPGGKLPQTGQLNWPVPVLAAAGLMLFAIGWAIRFRRKQDKDA